LQAKLLETNEKHNLKKPKYNAPSSEEIREKAKAFKTAGKSTPVDACDQVIRKVKSSKVCLSLTLTLTCVLKDTTKK
jgi:hypothetical protein